MRAWLLGFLLLLSPMLSLAQGSRYQAYALDQSGRPLGNLQVRVCVSPVTSTPCANPASLFTDAALGTPAPNPVTTDSVGNFAFYTTPGFYHLQYFQPGATASIYEEDIQVSLTTPTGSVNATYVDASIGYKVAGTYGTNGQCLTSTGVASIWGACGAGGGGTVTSVSCGGLGPLFSCSVGTPTTTPSIAFTLSNAAGNTVYGNNTGGSAPPGFQSLVLAQLPSAGAHTIATTSPLGGGGSVALGGTLTLTCTGCLTTAVSSIATTGPITGGTITTTGTIACATCVTASAPGAGIAHFAGATQSVTSSAVTSADTTGTFPATAHNLLSATHGDSTAGTVARGDLITGQTATPKWTRLAKGTANQLLAMDATGTDIVWAAPPGGTGTVTSFSAGNAAPLFTTSVATATTTPALTFNMTAAAAHTFYMNNTAGLAAAGFQTPGKLDLLTTTVYTDQSNAYSTATTQDFYAATAAHWGGAPVFDASSPWYVGADMCARIVAVYSDAAYLAATRAIVDATGFTSDQNCASNILNVPRTTWIKVGNVKLHTTVNQAASFPPNLLPVPPTPTAASTAATGGTLNNLVLVKIGYATAWLPPNVSSLAPSAEATITMGGTCAGTPTCTATINSPAAVVGAYGYNVYQSTTTGAEKLCNVAPIPIGTNYTIKANCAGTAAVNANWAFVDTSILSGIGDSTQWSLENAAASIDGTASTNWIFKDMSIVSTLTTQSVNGMLQLLHNERADNITFSGGGNHIYYAGGSGGVIAHTRHFGFTQTTGPVSAIQVFGGTMIRVEDTTLANFTFPVSATLNNGVVFSGCTMCINDGQKSYNIDNSNAVNGGSMMAATGDGTTAGASSNILFTNFQCDRLINVNCGDFLNMTHDATMSNGICRNSNNTAGVGANILGADCFDIFMAGHISLTNLLGNHRGGTGGLCCPTLEAYSVSDMSVNGSNFSDDQGNEGVRIVGSPAVTFNGVIADRNLNSGIVLADLSAVVTCNGTTTVAWVSGQPFGPWQPGTQVWIGAGPTAFNIASVTDFHTLVLSTTCGLGASQAFSVYTQDTTINAAKLDDNGQAGTGTGVRTGLAEGVYVSGHSVVTINGGSSNDNAPVLANKHQQYAARTENSARMVVNMMDGSGNGGGSNCLNVRKPMGATTEWFCDSSGLSPILTHDGATNKVVALTPVIANFGINDQGQSATVADTGAINTTETIIAKSLALPANRLVAGTVIRIPFVGTNTSSVANTSTFTLRMGTLGTTSDAAIFTAVMAVSATTGTNVPFEGEVICNVRTIGASGTGFCKINLNNPNATSVATASTGISVIPMQLVLPTMSTFNTQTANQFIELTYKSAATTTTSIFKIGDVLFSHL